MVQVGNGSAAFLILYRSINMVLLTIADHIWSCQSRKNCAPGNPHCTLRVSGGKLTVSEWRLIQIMLVLRKIAPLLILLWWLFLLPTAPGRCGTETKNAKTIGPELITNGSFEQTFPRSAEPWTTLAAPSTGIVGWRVSKGDVDVVTSPSFNIPYGNQAVELNGWYTGALSQQMKTEPGASYLVTFALSGGWENAGAVRPMYVRAANTKQIYQPVCTCNKNSNSMQWNTMSFQFVANSANTTLEFGSNTEGYRGANIDNVSVRKLDVPLKQFPAAATPGISTSPLLDLPTTEVRLRGSIEKAFNKGFIEISAEGKFDPSKPVSKRDFVKWLVKLKGLAPASISESPSYEDVPADDPYFPFIEAAAKAGLLPEEDRFHSADTITRQELAQLYCIFSGMHDAAENQPVEEVERGLCFSRGTKGNTIAYRDANLLDEEARKWVSYANKAGILNLCFGLDPAGTTNDENLFEPRKRLTRGEAIHLLVSLYDLN